MNHERLREALLSLSPRRLNKLLDTYWEAVVDSGEYKTGEFMEAVVDSFFDNIHDMSKDDACDSLANIIIDLIKEI